MRESWTRFHETPGATPAVATLSLVVLAALCAPLIFTDSPWDMVGSPFTPPLAGPEILGTDTLGRDVFVDIVYGARVSLLVGLTSTITATIIGILVGAAAGYCGGVVDDLAMRCTEFFQTIPSFIFAIVLVAVLHPSIGS